MHFIHFTEKWLFGDKYCPLNLFIYWSSHTNKEITGHRREYRSCCWLDLAFRPCFSIQLSKLFEHHLSLNGDFYLWNSGFVVCSQLINCYSFNFLTLAGSNCPFLCSFTPVALTRVKRVIWRKQYANWGDKWHSKARCLYNKVRYFRGFCVSGVGGAAYRWQHLIVWSFLYSI
jgi:hypothetical protein